MHKKSKCAANERDQAAKYLLTEKSSYSATELIYPVIYETEHYVLIEKK